MHTHCYIRLVFMMQQCA